MEGTMSEIRLFAGDFAPKTWALCQGQTLAINTNQALFSLLGTTYGGNGITTFMLPNFAGRVPMGTGYVSGVQKYELGQIDGTPNVTMSPQQMPMHTHAAGTERVAIQTYSEGGNSGSPSGNILASLAGLYSDKAADSTLKPINAAFSLTSTGGNQPFSIQQPFLGMNYIICLNGIFPSRN